MKKDKYEYQCPECKGWQSEDYLIGSGTEMPLYCCESIQGVPVSEKSELKKRKQEDINSHQHQKAGHPRDNRIQCKNCGHKLIKVDKNKKIIYLHFNRAYFGAMALNDAWCSYCEVIHLDKRTERMREVCQNPEPLVLEKGGKVK